MVRFVSRLSRLSSAIGKLRVEGTGVVARRRLRWYRERLRGTLISLSGNTISMDGMTYSVAPFSSTLKSTLANGRHEQPERDLVRRWLPEQFPLVELGGGMGAVSCLANRKLANPTRHVVVEANPAMVPLLTYNRDLNACSFVVINEALGYDRSTISLDIDPDFVGSSAFGVPGQGTATVEAPTTTLVKLMDRYGFDTCGVVCDIEGLEADLVEREFSKLGERVRYIMAETHPFIIGQARIDHFFATLQELGFSKKQAIGDCVFFARVEQ